MIHLSILMKKKAEGFPEQRLWRQSVEVLEWMAKHSLLGGCMVTDAGSFPRTAAHEVRRPQGTGEEVLILCAGGKGWVESGGGRREIPEGTLLWIPAGCPHVYGSDARIPWQITWLHFRGTQAGATRDLFGSGNQPFTFLLQNPHVWTAAFEQLYSRLLSGSTQFHLLAALAAFQELISLTLQQRQSRGQRTRQGEERIIQALDWMENHLQEPLRLADLAAAVHLSVPQFSALFKAATGTPPVRYLTRLRMQHASQLLHQTDLPITEIGRRVGIDNLYLFSRNFKTHMGVSPVHYRNLL